VRAYNKVPKCVEHGESSNGDGVVRGGINDKSEGVEDVAVEWGRELCGGVQFVDPVFYCEGGLHQEIPLELVWAIREGRLGGVVDIYVERPIGWSTILRHLSVFWGSVR